MGSLHFVGGEKGGVGKSFTSRLLAQYFIDSKSEFVGFDTDASHCTFSRFYKDYTTRIDVEDSNSLDQIIETADNEPNANIIVDLAAQTSQKVNQWISGCGLFEIMSELGFNVYFWHVMDDGADSANLLNTFIQNFSQTNVRLIVVQNYGRGKSFRLFEQTQTYQLAKEKSANFVSFPKLEETLTQKIDFGSLSFWAAAHIKESMKIAERHRVKIWLNFCYQQIGNAINSAANTFVMSQPQQEIQKESSYD